jgi:hypothetical protein
VGQDWFQGKFVVFEDGGGDVIPARRTFFEVRYDFFNFVISSRIQEDIDGVIFGYEANGGSGCVWNFFVEDLADIDEEVVKRFSYLRWVLDVVSIDEKFCGFRNNFFFIYDGFDDGPRFTKVILG